MYTIIRKFLSERKKTFDLAQPVKDLIAGPLHAKIEAEGEGNEDRTALLTDDYFINTIEDMFSAGYETTSTTMKWVLALLVNYPHYQEAIQGQLDEVIGDQTPSFGTPVSSTPHPSDDYLTISRRRRREYRRIVTETKSR